MQLDVGLSENLLSEVRLTKTMEPKRGSHHQELAQLRGGYFLTSLWSTR